MLTNAVDFPVITPLRTLESVLEWAPGYDDLCISRVPLRQRSNHDNQKLLVCHDMMGGYTGDRYVQVCMCMWRIIHVCVCYYL